MAEKLTPKRSAEKDKLASLQNSYLHLLQKFLSGSIFRDAPNAPFGPSHFDPKTREHGLDWPASALTMIGEKRIANLRKLTESIISEGIPGDLIETGIWRGGACIMMRAILLAYSIDNRTVWAADSFEGLPPANESKYPADLGSNFHTYKELAITLDEVQENFRSLGLLDKQVKFLKGWFKDTLPQAPIGNLALIRLDGDMYESTIDALNSLYPKLSPNGYIIIDDYHVVPACKTAVLDYCNSNGIRPEIIEIDGVGVYWRKTEVVANKTKAEPTDQRVLDEIKMENLNQAMVLLNNLAIQKLEQSLSQRDAEIDQLNQVLSKNDSDVSKFKENLNKHEQQNNMLGKALEDSNAEISKLKENLNKHEEQNNMLGKALEDSNAEISKLKENLNKHEEQNNMLGKALEDSNAKISKLKQVTDEQGNELAQLYSSTSWRITKPLRVFKKLFSGEGAQTMDATLSPERIYEQPQETGAKLHRAVTMSPNKPKLIWESDTHLKIDDIHFYLSYNIEELQEESSSQNNFLLGKPKHMVEKTVRLGQRERFQKVFEMGILQGGSVVLYDQILAPQKIVAIDHAPDAVKPLEKYITKHKKNNSIKPYYSINQAFRPSMEWILSSEFADKDIDLIVDDASHFYEETREAFNISFPYLKAGGLYIIEDWAWAHWTGDYWQKEENAYLAGKTALSNLLVELFMLCASRPDLIEDISIDHNSIILRKGNGQIPEGNFNIAEHYLLRGKHFEPRL